MKQIVALSLAFAILILSKAYSQTKNTERKYTQMELYQDIDSLKSYIIQTHPNPFSVISKNNFEDKIEDIKSRIFKPLTLREYYNLIAPLVASISDGHTSIKFAGNRFMTDESPLFPFIATLSYNNPNITITDYIYNTPSPIPKGSEIVSINNISSKEIIEKIVASTSGESKLYRLKIAGNNFLGSLLFTYFDFGDTFVVKFKFNNELYSKIIPSITFSNLRKAAQLKQKSSANTKEIVPDYRFILKKKIKTAIIDFRSFNDPAAFNNFLYKSFETIKNEQIENLVIDITENGGGNSSLGDLLFKYISKNNFTQFGKTIVKYSRLQKNFFKKMCEEDSSNCETYHYMNEQEDGKIDVFESDSLIQPNKKPFKGNIYLLTSLNTFSSASDFAQCFKHYKMGTIIGEETGGWIVSYGDIITTTLPNTNLLITISQKKFNSVGATDQDFHGVIPDIKINSENALNYILKKIEVSKVSK